MNLTVIIPAYNEEQRIGAMFDDYLPHFRGRAHFLVVINGTTDRTADVVSAYARRFPGLLSSMVIPEAIGKGGAITEGFRQVTTSWVGYADADGATPASSFEEICIAAEAADGAIASRWLPGSQARRTVLRGFVGGTFHLAVRWIVGLPFQDTQCGYKVFRTSLVRSILSQLSVRNMAFDVELLALLRQRGARIREVPTVWREVPTVWPKNIILTGWEMFRTLIAIRRRLANLSPTAS